MYVARVGGRGERDAQLDTRVLFGTPSCIQPSYTWSPTPRNRTRCESEVADSVDKCLPGPAGSLANKYFLAE